MRTVTMFENVSVCLSAQVVWTCWHHSLPVELINFYFHKIVLMHGMIYLCFPEALITESPLQWRSVSGAGSFVY